MFSSCPIASIIRRQIASPAQLPASASSSARIALFYIRLVAVTFQHQVGDAPDVNFRDHARQVIGQRSTGTGSTCGKSVSRRR